jgi:hypothetical protein
VAINGRVFDLSSLSNDHPGGAGALAAAAGTDASLLFYNIHSNGTAHSCTHLFNIMFNRGADVYEWLDGFEIGLLAEAVHAPVELVRAPELKQLDAPGPASYEGEGEGGQLFTGPDVAKRVALHPRRWLTLRLKERLEVAASVYRFVFERDDKGTPLGLPAGAHVLMGADVTLPLRRPADSEAEPNTRGGVHASRSAPPHPHETDSANSGSMTKLVVRPYSPILPVNDKEDKGTVEFIIKVVLSAAIDATLHRNRCCTTSRCTRRTRTTHRAGSCRVTWRPCRWVGPFGSRALRGMFRCAFQCVPRIGR